MEKSRDRKDKNSGFSKVEIFNEGFVSFEFYGLSKLVH